MTGKQRFLTALDGGKPDRVPIFLRDLTLGLDLCDYTTPEVSAVYDAEKAALAVLASQARFHQDAVVGCIHDLGLDAEPLGGSVRFPEVGIPVVDQHPLAEEDAARHAAAYDPETSGRWPQVLEAYGRVKAAVGNDTAVVGNIEGPVTRAGVLRGAQQFAMDLSLDRELAAQIVDLSGELAVRHVRALVKAGVDVVFVAAASDGPSFISPRDYLAFTIPGLRRIVEAAAESGTPVIFHPHGAFTDDRHQQLVDAAIECGIRGFQFCESCDLALAKRMWGDEVCVLGGPDVPTVLMPGPVELVQEVTRGCLRDCMGDGGYVIMASCSLHRGSPLAHLDAMVQTVLEHGVYA